MIARRVGSEIAAMTSLSLLAMKILNQKVQYCAGLVDCQVIPPRSTSAARRKVRPERRSRKDRGWPRQAWLLLGSLFALIQKHLTQLLRDAPTAKAGGLGCHFFQQIGRVNGFCQQLKVVALASGFFQQVCRGRHAREQQNLA